MKCYDFRNQVMLLKRYAAFMIIILVLFTLCGCRLGKRIKGMKLEPSELTLEAGTSQKISLVVEPAEADASEVQWSTVHPEVASIDNNGTITAKKPGSTVIIVKSKDGKKSAASTVKVKEKSVKSVELDKNILTLEAGAASKLQVKITPEDAGNKNVTWESSNAKIVSVDKDGNLKAISQGSGEITVKTEDGQFTDKCMVTVKPAPVANENTTPSKPDGTTSAGNQKTGITADNRGNAFVLYENGKNLGTYSVYVSINLQPYQILVTAFSIPKGPVLNYRAVINIDGKDYTGTGKTDGGYYTIPLPWGISPPKGNNKISVYMTYKGKEFKITTTVYVR